MKTLTEIKQILQTEKLYLAEKYGVIEIGVFGSYVRDEQRPDSDIDVLIELERPPRISLIGLVELEHYLSDVLGIKVDVAIKKNLKKRIGKRILSFESTSPWSGPWRLLARLPSGCRWACASSIPAFRGEAWLVCVTESFTAMTTLICR
jgi:predicted nucleotidyltransferase